MVGFSGSFGSWVGGGRGQSTGRGSAARRWKAVASSFLQGQVAVGEEGLRGSGAVGADQDLGAVPVSVGDLCEGVVQHRDVIGGGVGSGVAGPRSARHGLAGVSEETQQRMKAEAAFVSERGLFLFRVGGNQHGVEVQDQAGKFSSAGLDGGYALAGLGRLHPGDFPG